MLWKQKPPLGTPLIPTHPHLDGLECWCLFQEGHGDQVYDLSGNDNTGTLNNFAFPATITSGWNPGKFGEVIKCDGVNDHIDIPYSAGVNVATDPHTFTLWVNPFSVAVNGIVLSAGELGGARRFYLGIRGTVDDRWSIGIDHSSWGAAGDIDAVAGQWDFLALVMDGANAILYVNGEIADIKAYAPFTLVADIDIGRHEGDANYMKCGVDDVRIFSKALTEAEVKDIYENPFAAFSRWPLAQIYPPVAAPVSTYYPTLTYPDPPLFPVGHDDVPIAGDFYTAVTSYITALAADATLLFDQIGNFELGATEGISWDDAIRVELSGGEIRIIPLQVDIELVVDTPTLNTLNVTGDIAVTNDLIVGFATLTIGGTATADYVDRLIYKLTAQIDEPGDPADNTAIFWMSSGVGYGDAADLCCKITEGGGTTDVTISDYTAL